MTWQELQQRAVHLSVRDRWRLVQSLLNSIQEETLSLDLPNSNASFMIDLDPWTQSLVGVIQLDTETPTESYVDYLEEKYR